jgi:hypothetical protein
MLRNRLVIYVMRSSFKAQTHGSELDATCTTPAIALVNAEVVRDVRTTPKIHIQIERGESKIQKRIEAMNALQMKVHTHTPTRTHTHHSLCSQLRPLSVPSRFSTCAYA